MSKIHFYFLQKGVSLADRQRLKSFIASLLKREKRALQELNYVFCSDEYLLELNRQFLHHDYYTDILTFNLSSPSSPLHAEVYVSVDRVRENAGDFNSSIKKELHRVIFHGALHLCGFQDKTRKQAEIMRKMEENCLIRYFSGAF